MIGPVDSDLGVIAYGRVTDREGVPVPGARLTFENEGAFRRSTRSAPDGSWSRAGLVPGGHELRATLEAFLPHVEAVEVPAQRGWRHDVVLDRALSLPVRFEQPDGDAYPVGDRGELTRFLAVVATEAKPGPRIPGVLSRVAYRHGVGTYRSRAEQDAPTDLPARYQGVLAVSALPPVWVSAVCRDVVLESRELVAPVDELVFTVEPEQLEDVRGGVRVRLVEAGSGLPITEHVRIHHPSGGVYLRPQVEGNVLVFSGVPPGPLELKVEGGGWELLERRVVVLPGETFDLGTISLGRREPFEVRVVDEAGAPLGIGISAVRPDLLSCLQDLDISTGAFPGADGVATVRHLAPGLTLLRAGGDEGRARVARLVDTVAERELELVVPLGVEVVLVRRGGFRSGAEYALEDGDGNPLIGGRGLPRDVWLAPGRYTIRELEDGRELARYPFTVGSERTVVRY